MHVARMVAALLVVISPLAFPSVQAVPVTSVTATCSTTLSNGWCPGSETITISCTPTGGSSFVSSSYQIDGGGYTAVTTNPFSFSYSSQGTHTVHAICQDSVPSSSDATTTFKIDSLLPAASGVMPFATVGGGAYTVSITVSDAGSGLTGTLNVEEGTGGYVLPDPVGAVGVTWATVSSTAVTGTSATATLTRTPPGAGTYCYRVTVSDAAGNTLTGFAWVDGAVVNNEYACVVYAPMP